MENRSQIAIGQLLTEFREIIPLREFENLSYQEIVGVLNCPAGTVMPAWGSAPAKLRSVDPDIEPARNLGEASHS